MVCYFLNLTSHSLLLPGSNLVFGQPLTTVLDQDKSRTVNSPTHMTPPASFSIATSALSAIATSVVPLSPSTTAHLHPVS